MKRINHKELGKIVVNGNWIEGEFGGFGFSAKVYSEPSEYGIRDGHVSKLSMVTAGEFSHCVVNYDRGWDVGFKQHKVYMPLVNALTRFAKTETFKEAYLTGGR